MFWLENMCKQTSPQLIYMPMALCPMSFLLLQIIMFGYLTPEKVTVSHLMTPVLHSSICTSRCSVFIRDGKTFDITNAGFGTLVFYENDGILFINNLLHTPLTLINLLSI